MHFQNPKIKMHFFFPGAHKSISTPPNPFKKSVNSAQRVETAPETYCLKLNGELAQKVNTFKRAYKFSSFLTIESSNIIVF
jgi:hypothetical protein